MFIGPNGAGGLTAGCEDGPSQTFYGAPPIDYFDAAPLGLPPCTRDTAWRIPGEYCPQHAMDGVAYAFCNSATGTYDVCGYGVRCSLVAGSSVGDADANPCVSSPVPDAEALTDGKRESSRGD